MSADQISEANESLAKPPLVGLALSRSLGFIVVGRLATRHGIAVRMMPSPSGGVTAVVSLPPPLVTEAPGLAAVAHDGAAAPSRLTPVAETVAPAESEVAPLTFAPLEVGGATLESVPMPTEATAVPTGPVRAEMGAPGANGTLPTRRLTSAPVMPERTAVPTPVDLTPAEPVLRAAPEPPGVGGEHPAGTAPLTFTDPGPVHDEAFDAPSHLDGPPPAAPPLPSRGPAPTPRPAARTPKPESENKPFFLEEAAPPRLFGRQVEPEVEATPPPAPVPVPAAASVASPPRLFGTQAEPAAPAAPAAPPLARRGSPTSPPASPDAPVARPAPAASEPAEVVRTTAGLAKRTPRPAGGGGRAIPGADVERGAGATRRSPDEVRNLLSRYRDGQQRARTEEPVTAGSTHEEGTP
jgi:hypothetical protein